VRQGVPLVDRDHVAHPVPRVQHHPRGAPGRVKAQDGLMEEQQR
jgi:hypothetical protein